MPTAVITESSEKTMSRRMIWIRTLANVAFTLALECPSSPSRFSWISKVLLPSRKSPPLIRITSRPEISCPRTVNSGAVSPMTQLKESSKRIRMRSAMPSPSRRASACLCSGSLSTRIEMKTMLSIQRTTEETQAGVYAPECVEETFFEFSLTNAASCDDLKTLMLLKSTSNACGLELSQRLPRKPRGAKREEALGDYAPNTRRDRAGQTGRLGLRPRKPRGRRARQRRLRRGRATHRRREGSLHRSQGARGALPGGERRGIPRDGREAALGAGRGGREGRRESANLRAWQDA